MAGKMELCLQQFDPDLKLPIQQPCSCDNTSSAKNLARAISYNESLCLTHRESTVMVKSLERIFDKKKFPETYCEEWHGLHKIVVGTNEKGQYVKSKTSLPAMAKTRTFRGYEAAYSRF